VPELAVQTVLGVAYQPSPLTRLGVEVYRKHWSHVSPYFDNSLERLSLLPDLVPDRLLVAPTAAPDARRAQFGPVERLFHG
jgi:hypothetical protein